MSKISQTSGFLFQFNVNSPGFAAVIETNFGDGTGARIKLNQSPYSFLATADSPDGPFLITAVTDDIVIEALLDCFRFTFISPTQSFNVSFPTNNPCQFPSPPGT